MNILWRYTLCMICPPQYPFPSLARVFQPANTLSCSLPPTSAAFRWSSNIEIQCASPAVGLNPQLQGEYGYRRGQSIFHACPRHCQSVARQEHSFLIDDFQDAWIFQPSKSRTRRILKSTHYCDKSAAGCT